MLEGYDLSTYGDSYASAYDDWWPEVGQAESEARVLAELGRNRLLELGVGTGRVALALARSGLTVHGVDSSPQMLDVLKTKSVGLSIEVTLGDFADVPVEGSFDLIYCVKNTFFMLTSQQAQVRCFKNVAPHLNEGGCFLLETFVPAPSRFDNHQRVNVKQLHSDAVLLQASVHDPISQVVSSHDIIFGPNGVELHPVMTRYVWPAELDLMAELAGLRLRDRWSGWDRSPFTADSKSLISLYSQT